MLLWSSVQCSPDISPSLSSMELTTGIPWLAPESELLGVFVNSLSHYDDVIMSSMASQITSLMIIYLTVYSGTDQRKHQSSASLAFVRGINREPVNSPHKWPVTRRMFPFDDVIIWLNSMLHFWLLCSVQYRITLDRDISRVYIIGQCWPYPSWLLHCLCASPSTDEAALKHIGKWIAWPRTLDTI